MATDVKTMLDEIAAKAVDIHATNKARYTQLKNVDNKTKTVCQAFLLRPNMEPVERELLAEQLVILQRVRTSIVAEILKDNQHQ